MLMAAEPVPGNDFVLFLEDNDDLRDMVVDLVEAALERPCVGVASYDELVAMGRDVLACGLAILDINLGPRQPSGIDAYIWLRDKGYIGRIVFLTGHADSHPLVVQAERLGDAEILSKPIAPDHLRMVIEGAHR